MRGGGGEIDIQKVANSKLKMLVHVNEVCLVNQLLDTSLI